MASLTKIMTASVILRIIEKHGLNPDKIVVTILQLATTPFLGGTSAELLPKDKLTVSELLYGMMLPSGNDAA